MNISGGIAFSKSASGTVGFGLGGAPAATAATAAT